MADSKYQRFIQLFPKTFRPQDGDEVLAQLPPGETVGKTIAELWQASVANPVLNAVLRGFAEADDNIVTALNETKASLFVKTAEAQQLDVIASSLGVSRPGSLGLSDSAFQNLVPPLSLRAKQVRQSFYNAMDAFYGPEFSRANLITLNTTSSVFDLRLNDSLTFIVDDGENQVITIKSTSGIANVGVDLTAGQATALELNNLIKDNITGVTSEILVDPITNIQTVRVLTTTPGLRGSVQFSFNRDDIDLDRNLLNNVDGFNMSPPPNPLASDELLLDGNHTDTGSFPFLPGDVITFRQGGGSFPSTFTTRILLEVVGLVTTGTLTGTPSTRLRFTTSVAGFNFVTGGPNDAVAEFLERDIFRPDPVLFPLEKAELLKQDQRTVVYELRPNEVIIELPAVLPSLERGLKGSLHLHKGPILNNLIFTGESTNLLLPDNLYENATVDITPIETITLDSDTGTELTLTGDISQILVGDLISFTDSVLERVIGTARVTELVTPSIIRINVAPPQLTVMDTITLIQRDNFYSVESAESWITYNQDTRIISFDPPPGLEIGVYEYTITNTQNAAQSFKAFVRVDNRLSPSTDQQIWVGAFIFDPGGTQTPFTVSGESAIITGDAITGVDTLAAGRVFPRVNVEPSTNTLPTTSGLAVIGYGSSSQEPSLIRYRGRAADNIIELDPSFIFTKNQSSGTYINIVSTPTPFTPDKVGSDYPIYLTSSTEARVVVQNILQSLAAAGVVVNFVVLAPDYKYLIDNPYLTTDNAPVV